MKSCHDIKDLVGTHAEKGGAGALPTSSLLPKTTVDSGFRGVHNLSRFGSRERKVAYDVLDIMDFGVNGRSGFPSPISANLVLRRNESKDQRKRWNSEKVQVSRTPTQATSETLCAALAIHQPSVATIVGRAQATNSDNVDQSRRSRRKNNCQG